MSGEKIASLKVKTSWLAEIRKLCYLFRKNKQPSFLSLSLS